MPPIRRTLYEIFDIIKIDVAIPSTGITGSLPIDIGTLKPLFIGFLNL